MKRLVFDSLRRNAVLLLVGCILAFFLLPMFVGCNLSSRDRDSNYMVLGFYFLLCNAFFNIFSMRNEAAALRVWRSFPFSAACLANLVWFQSVLVFPVLAFGMFNASRFACVLSSIRILPGFTWPFCLFLLGILYSGLACFMSVSYQWTLTCVTDGRGVKARRRSWLKFFGLIIPALYSLIRLISPPPLAWTELSADYAVAVALALGFTVQTYRMRIHLIRMAPATGTFARPAAERAPRAHPSRLALLTGEWRTAAAKGILVVLTITSLYLYPVYDSAAWHLNWRGEVGRILGFLPGGVWLLGIPLAVSMQRTRVYAVRRFRSLPLTSGQCALLYLSYPLAGLAGAFGILIIASWVVGEGPTLLVTGPGILISVAFCPLLMIALVRFGTRGIPWFLFGAIIAPPLGVAVVQLSAEYWSLLPSFPGSVGFCACMFLLVVLAIAGYHGLRYTLETCSGIYHRKIEPREVGSR